MTDFKMVGRDLNSSPTQYRTWVVADEPDFDGYYYTGLKSGDHPFVDVTAYNLSSNDGYPVDFNLPLPKLWKTTKRTLPAVVSNSHFAILDGYAYLFGGEMSDVIYRADINNPADWIDTGGRLPTPLCGASLSIIDGYIYLFGGETDGYESVDTIYKASVADPLTWSNEGSLLPKRMRQSQTAIVDGYVYLFGGREINVSMDVIYRAPLTDPLNWSDTGFTLPERIYGSHIAIMNDKLYLLGGLLLPDSPTANIYSAPLTNPTNWSIVGVLPWPTCYGQFVTIGFSGYLYAPAAFTNSQPYETRIFTCDVRYPIGWSDTKATIPGDVSQSQIAIIYDRIFLFGGSGSSIIFACEQQLKYAMGSGTPSFTYGDITRTQLTALGTPDEVTDLLGFPYWKTDYKY